MTAGSNQLQIGVVPPSGTQSPTHGIRGGRSVVMAAGGLMKAPRPAVIVLLLHPAKGDY